jgi:hypothetical protein
LGVLDALMISLATFVVAILCAAILSAVVRRLPVPAAVPLPDRWHRMVSPSRLLTVVVGCSKNRRDHGDAADSRNHARTLLTRGLGIGRSNPSRARERRDRPRSEHVAPTSLEHRAVTPCELQERLARRPADVGDPRAGLVHRPVAARREGESKLRVFEIGESVHGVEAADFLERSAAHKEASPGEIVDVPWSLVFRPLWIVSLSEASRRP